MKFEALGLCRGENITLEELCHKLRMTKPCAFTGKAKLDFSTREDEFKFEWTIVHSPLSKDYCGCLMYVKRGVR